VIDKKEGGEGLYLWEKGNLTSILSVGQALPGWGTAASILDARLNNNNRNVLIDVRADKAGGAPSGFYLWSQGDLKPVAVPGQTMPDGGRFSKVLGGLHGSFNDLGQYIFPAILEGGDHAVYLIDPEGNLSPVLRTGMTTDLGKIQSVGTYSNMAGMGLNN